MNDAIRRLAPLATWLVGGVFACAVAVATPHTDRAALESATHRWMSAVNAQDVETLTGTMTADVELHGNMAAVTGRDAVIRKLREVATRGPMVATTHEITIANDVAWRLVGLTQTRSNGDVHALGKALEIWKRVNGEWRLHRHMAGDVIAPAISLTRPSTSEPVLDQPENQR
jgi:ketosteroid isomerase-like protein